MKRVVGSIAANRIWKEGTRRGIVYVEGREMAEQVMTLTGRRPEALATVVSPPTGPPTRRRVAAGAAATAAATPGRTISAAALAQDAVLLGAMAVYSDRKGRPFAWQIPFDIGYWEAVSAAVLGEDGTYKA